MTAASGQSMTLVESSAPPMPTSSTTISQRRSANQSIAAAVTSSNWLGWSSIVSAAARTRSVTEASSSPGMFSPSSRMRSQKS